jgi:signal transduction histidine kinase
MRMEESIAESPVIDGRPGDMNHVFMNLLDNAIRAVRPSGVIRVDAGMENDVYVIRVADSGRGVDSEVISRIFEPFFTTRSAGDGTGLGLAIAKSVVEHHGGTISVGQSDLGGALFMVRIPTTSDSAGTGSSSKDSAQLAQRSLQG